ncbi:copper-binding protein [Methylocystis iwaonis]|uniref:copper-binding protein n=1 Tax=Methylocystis iwaonis TaxID=2885079 RepID=UPI002E7B38E0|nr:copper-binding protein [Methylocystis iwaonis]
METALRQVLKLAAALGLALAGVSSVAAQSPGRTQIAEAVEKATGQGVVEAVNEEERQLRITHEAIPALKWPPMTMAFKVAPGVRLEGLGPGAKVTFTLSKSAQGYVIDQIQRVQ